MYSASVQVRGARRGEWGQVGMRLRELRIQKHAVMNTSRERLCTRCRFAVRTE